MEDRKSILNLKRGAAGVDNQNVNVKIKIPKLYHFCILEGGGLFSRSVVSPGQLLCHPCAAVSPDQYIILEVGRISKICESTIRNQILPQRTELVDSEPIQSV